MNVASLGQEKFELHECHTLRRATADEISVIKETLQQFLGVVQSLFMFIWEDRLPRSGGSIQKLPESDWRYFVIGFQGNNEILNEISAASDLAPLELEIGFIVLAQGGVMTYPARIFHVVEDARSNPAFFVEVSENDIRDIQTIHSQLRHADGELLKDVNALAGQMNQLKGFPHKSPLRFLGYFATLESLLTHPPKPSDPYDSITRQVKKKIALLDNRWTRRIDYGPFGGAAAETVWTKMYAYRSLLAHGGNPEFTGELASLGNHEQALRLIKETVKAVIRQLLVEPTLLRDLREC